ncbi:MAG: DUF4358 domain-containing protein [Oscillospiraceae bacterium]|nr:DUF4358 domain-containing protein [Oscillospiraceae bacterium]
MKKIIAMISAVAMCAAMFTACSSESDTSATETTETTVADTTVSETVAEETEESVDEVPAETEESVEESTEEDVPSEDGGEVGANPLQALADAALAAGEWPAMMEITDTMMLTDYFMLDPENANYRNMIVMQCPMSATMSEVIIIEADDVEAAKADLNARREKAITQDAWYPNDVELAEASIVGTEGDYAYFILAAAAAEAEPALVEAIKAL